MKFIVEITPEPFTNSGGYVLIPIRTHVTSVTTGEESEYVTPPLCALDFKWTDYAKEAMESVLNDIGDHLIELVQSADEGGLMKSILEATEPKEKAKLAPQSQGLSDWSPEFRSLSERYDELIMAVCRKHPNETRHQTALRYIQETESREVAGDAGEATNSERLKEGESE